MSDTNEQPAEEQEASQSQAPAVDEGTSPKSRSRPWLALLALVLALFALGLSGWQWHQATELIDPDEAAEDERSALSERIDVVESGLGELDARVDAKAADLGDRETRIESLEQALASVTASVDTLQGELATLEDDLGQRIQELSEREGEQRQADRELDRRMLMLEAASMLRLGQERAELAADWPGAREAYRRASALLRQADDPRLSAVRRELTRELDALESIESPDWLRIQVRIERVAGQAHRWPRPPIAGLPEAETVADDDADTAWTDSLKAVFGQLVRVRPRDSIVLSDEELELLRRQVLLRLTAAELAAARRDGDELAHHLRAAGSVLTSSFDPADSSVREALQELDELAQFSPAAAPSGMGRALAELREHMDRS